MGKKLTEQEQKEVVHLRVLEYMQLWSAIADAMDKISGIKNMHNNDVIYYVNQVDLYRKYKETLPSLDALYDHTEIAVLRHKMELIEKRFENLISKHTCQYD